MNKFAGRRKVQGKELLVILNCVRKIEEQMQALKLNNLDATPSKHKSSTLTSQPKSLWSNPRPRHLAALISDVRSMLHLPPSPKIRKSQEKEAFEAQYIGLEAVV